MAAPAAILWGNTQLKAHKQRPLSYRFAGSQGDVNHTYGYHCTPNQIGRRNDYSLKLALDLKKLSLHREDASAWDLSFSAKYMKIVTERLYQAAVNKDPRMFGVREFAGTRNGRDVFSYDMPSRRGALNEWDRSHITHNHISFYRFHCDNRVAIFGVIEIICGVPLSKTKIADFQVKKPKWPVIRGSK